MAKSLSARIAQRKAQGARNGKNKAAFLAVRDQVRKARDDGWSMFAIWETLHDEKKILTSYESFRRHVKRLIVVQRSKRGWEHDLVKKEKEKNMRKPASAGVRQKDNKTATTGLRGFVYNPVPNEEELF